MKETSIWILALLSLIGCAVLPRDNSIVMQLPENPEHQRVFISYLQSGDFFRDLEEDKGTGKGEMGIRQEGSNAYVQFGNPAGDSRVAEAMVEVLESFAEERGFEYPVRVKP